MLAAQGRQPSEKWIAVRLLEESYQVSNLGADVQHISHDDYDLVIVIHPKGLGDKALWALDEWVVTGGKTLVFLDPYSMADPAPQDAQQPWAALEYEPARRASNHSCPPGAWRCPLAPLRPTWIWP